MASPPRPSFYGDMGVPAVKSSESSDHSSPSSSSIVIWIISLTVIFSVSFCLLRHLYHRCLRRHLSRSSTSTTITAASSNRVRPEEESPTDSLLDSLPLFTFSSIISRSKDDSMVSADCPVCLSKFEPQDQLRLLPLCCHAFHAHCIDTWLTSSQSQTCPLCRSPLFASDSDLMKALVLSSNEADAIGREGGDSFRLELGSVSRPQPSSDSADQRRTFPVGSFDYIVDLESEVTMNQALRRNVSDKEDVRRPEPTSEASLAAEVDTGRSWLKEYVDRLYFSVSSRSLSFRSSGRIFTGSSRRSDNSDFTGEYDVEANPIGEEISEMFRWFSVV